MSVKSELIQFLLDHIGCWYSGEELAELFQVTRAAIWKAIGQLKEEGFDLASSRSRGYSLQKHCQMLSAEEIRHRLKDRYPVYVYQEITSTNDVLKMKAINDHAPEGTTVVSDFQSGGKGRLGRSFFSPKGTGLYISMLLRPSGSVIDNLKLTAQSAVAVYRAVRETTGIELGIKWVNDLYLNGRKVTGILSEGQADFESGRLDYVVVGIGINLYEPEEGFPEEIRNRAGSILGKKSDGREIDRNHLAAVLIEEFFRLAGDPVLAPEYMEKNIVPGHDITIINGEERRPAKALSILPDGRLHVQEADGHFTDLVYGEVSVRIAD